MANFVNSSKTDFGSRLLHPGWDKRARFELRSRPLFRQFVTERIEDPTNRSNVFYMPVHRYREVAENRHLVDEVVAADQVEAPASYYVRLQIHERGDAVGRTTFVDDVTYIPVDPVLAEQGAKHMGDTMDELVADVLYDGSQVRSNGSGTSDTNVPFTQLVSANADGTADFGYTEGGRSSLDGSNTLTARVTAKVRARLQNASVTPWTGEDFIGLMNPDVAVDFMHDTGSIGWQEPHKRVDTSNLYSGSIGRYLGVEWVVNPRARILDSEGAGGANVAQTLIFGRDILGEHVVREPGFGLSPTLDTYNRHRIVHWYGTLGHCVVRQEPLWRIEHGISEG